MPRSFLHLLGVCLMLPVLSQAIGLQRFEVQDPVRQSRIAAQMWYPSDSPEQTLRVGSFSLQVAVNGRPLEGRRPLLLISHGNGGNSLAHRDLADHLARAGFVVVTFTHPFDNHENQQALGTTLQSHDRPRELQRVLDHVLADPALSSRVDPQRIGAIGFSAGGYTVLASAAGDVQQARYDAYCSSQRDDPLTCKAYRERGFIQPVEPVLPVVADPRLKALVLMAPAGVFMLSDERLRQLQQPVLLYQASQDHLIREPFSVERLRKLLPNIRGDHRIEAGHFVFIAPCPSNLLAELAEICSDAPGIDRTAIHRQINNDVTLFFQQQLPPAP